MINAPVDDDSFDEDFYLKKYSDVAEAVRTGKTASGRVHYFEFGRSERRQGSGQEVDGTWYLNAYALAKREIDAGAASDPQDHYRRIGRQRGYLPFREAPRLDNPAAFSSRFGGFWTDLPNALDIVAGHLEIAPSRVPRRSIYRLLLPMVI